MHAWSFLVQELYLFREFFFSFHQQYCRHSLIRMLRRKKLYINMPLFFWQATNIQTKTERRHCPKHHHTRHAHIDPVTGRGGQTKCTGERRNKQQEMFNDFVQTCKLSKKKKKKRLSCVRNECIMWLKKKEEKPFVITGKGSPAKDKK